MEKLISLEPAALNQMAEWGKTNPKTLNKIFKLLEETMRNPFSGLGKPQPLKHDFRGYWSIRIDQEHRFIYKVEETKIIIVSCKDHY